MLEDYFQLLDLQKKYNIDKAELKSKYLSMQIKFHPDRATSEEERRIFLEQSIKLNEAEKVLKDDYLRAEYMLKLAGSKFDDKTLRDAISANELEEIMEMHEMVDDSEDLDELKQMEQIKLQEKDKMVQELEGYFNENNLAKALDLTVRLKYLTNLVKNIKLKVKNADSRDL